MKNSFFALAVIVTLYACTKDSIPIDNPATAPKISAVPAHFDQKIIIEQFTQTYCGQCPAAHITLDSLVQFNPDRVYGVSMHISDVLSDISLINPNGRNYYDSLFNPTGIYPSGLVNRHLSSLSDISPDQWSASALSELGLAPSCGLALEAEAISGNQLTLTVHLGFSEDLSGAYRLHTYIVENNFSSTDSIYDQLNDFSFEGLTPDTLSPYYNYGDTINNYNHQFNLVKVASAGGVEGDIIPETEMVKGNEYITNLNIDLTGINTGSCFILVFVDKYAQSLSGHWIENAQRVNFGETKNWN